MWTSIWCTKTMLNVSFKFMYLLLRLLMLLPAKHLLPLHWSLRWTNREVQKLLCVNAAASDAENLCMCCLASLVDILWEILYQNLWNNSARLKQFYLLNNASIINRQQKKILYSYHRNLLQFGNVVKSYRY